MKINLHSDITAAVLKKLYQIMLTIRRFEEKIIEVYPVQDMKTPVHLYIGQEAVAAGVCANLEQEDCIFSTHRSHGHYLAKGGDLKKMIAELYGKSTGCSRGKGGSMHLVDIGVNFMGSTAIVGGTIPIGVGLGLSIKLNKTDQISCVFLGDAAIEEGVFYES
ncbi:MAG: thiamine pyrophosphate-dependent dehydrogenase E1 component subunit alpha, partial [Pseudomonadota bacterium]